MDLPSYLQLEPVGQCNLRCQMCPVQFRNDAPTDATPAFMPVDLFRRIVDQFAALDHLHLQGLGEPMMHPRFFDMVQYAADRGIRVTTNSNLTLLSAKRAARCVSSGLDAIHVSIDAATPETYARIRVGGRLARVAHNFAVLQEARAQASSITPDVRITMVIMRQNLSELPEVVRSAHRWGCASVFVQHLCHDFQEGTLPEQYRSMREFVDRETLLSEDRQRLEFYFEAARQAADDLNIELRLPRIDEPRYPPNTTGPGRCNWPWQGMYASYQGYSMPCCMISTPDRLNFGSLSETPAKELWNSQTYETFRSQLGADNPPDICRSCSVYNGLF